MTGPRVFTPADDGYADRCSGFNARWSSSPKRVVLVRSPEETLAAVRLAVRERAKVAVRGGGHCFEAFVDNSDVDTIIDTSMMNTVELDGDAVVVGAGTRLGELYATLLERWDVTLPGGQCLSVSVGGHVAGGGYGPLCRRYGLISDYLQAVEVVVIDAHGPRLVRATREPGDPNHELWWAHTGGGGGNFGVVTRYWFRGAGSSPAGLPRPPATSWLGLVSWPWAALGEDTFARLLDNFGTWHAEHSGTDPSTAGLFARILPMHQAYGSILMDLQLDPATPDAEDVWRSFLAQVADGVGDPALNQRSELPWLAGVQALDAYSGDPRQRTEHKSAFLRKPFTAGQLAILHRRLTDDYAHPLSGCGISSYGGAVNLVAPDATASVQRDSIMKVLYLANWEDPAEDARHVGWLRDTYRELYASTGGVPAPGELTDGCSVNYPDIDLDDPAWNDSGLTSQDLYYGGNLARLRTVKAHWDPENFFSHQQSIRQ